MGLEIKCALEDWKQKEYTLQQFREELLKDIDVFVAVWMERAKSAEPGYGDYKIGYEDWLEQFIMFNQ